MIKCDPRAIARCPYKRPCGDNPYFLDGSDRDKFNQKVLEPPPTNADRIRSMSDEELADFIQTPFCDLIPGKCGGACHDCTLDWLQQPAEEG